MKHTGNRTRRRSNPKINGESANVSRTDVVVTSENVASAPEAPTGMSRGEKAILICGVSACALATFAASAYNYLVLAVFLSVAGTLGSHAVGKIFFPHYELYMPFCGGTEFMLLQAQGYTIVGLANVVAICVYWGNYEETNLFLSALGFAQAIGMWATAQALFFYKCDETKDRPVTLSMIRRGKRRMWLQRKRTPVIIAVILLGAALYCQGHFILGAMLSVVSGAYCVVHPLVNDVRGWKLWQPLEGGEAFGLLQTQGWLMLGLLLNVVISITQLEAEDSPGVGVGCSLLHAVSVACLSISVNLFETTKQSEDKEAKYVDSLFVRVRARTFYFLLVLTGILVLSSIPFLFCKFAAACTVNQLMMPLLAAPMAQTSGWYFIPTYRGFQLSGGFRSMLLQTNGWLLYLIAFVSSQTHSALFSSFMAPAGTCGALCIALSLYFHEDMETAEEKQGQPLAWYVTFGALCVTFVIWLDLTAMQLAILGLALHFLAIPAGFHMMWTHWWLVGSALAYCIDNEFLLVTFMCIGASLSVPWYLIGMIDFNSFLGFRALAGWSLFLGQRFRDAIAPGGVKKDFKGPFSHLNSTLDRIACYGGFLCFDLVMHLIPCLLQLRYLGNLSIEALLLAFVIGQCWRRLVSFHHLSPDWDLLLTSYRVKWHRRQHSEGYRIGGTDIAAFSAIYGFTNPDFPVHPDEMLQMLQYIEYAVYCILAAMCLVVPVDVLNLVSSWAAMMADCLIKVSVGSALFGNIGLVTACVRGWLSVKY